MEAYIPRLLILIGVTIQIKAVFFFKIPVILEVFRGVIGKCKLNRKAAQIILVTFFPIMTAGIFYIFGF